jgi:hypothetical protein
MTTLILFLILCAVSPALALGLTIVAGVWIVLDLFFTVR